MKCRSQRARRSAGFSGRRKLRVYRTLATLVAPTLCLAVLWVRPTAERLPITHFTDPLAPRRIQRVVQDSHGFIWAGTAEGLIRFDGQTFEHYGIEDGLPHSAIMDLLEADGEYWIATNGGGVARFHSSGAPRQTQSAASFAVSVLTIGDSAATQRVNVLFRDRAGSIWAGTDAGLFRRPAQPSDAGFVRVPLRLAGHADEIVQVWALSEDGAGTMWIGSRFGLLRRAADGQVAQYTIQSDAASDHVWALLLHEGRLWLGHNLGLIVFRPPPVPAAPTNHLQPRTATAAADGTFALPDVPGEARRYVLGEGIPPVRVQTLARSSSGSVWIGTFGSGLAEFHDGRFFPYTRAHGLSELFVHNITEDRSGNVWVGTRGGMFRIARKGFITYGEPDGLGPIVGSVFEKDGQLYVSSFEFLLSRFDGTGFTTVKPRLPPGATGWRSQNVLLDHGGEWWLGTREGVFRFPRVNRFEQLGDVLPTTYTVREGLADNDVAGLFEDEHGDIWIAHFAPGREVLTRWDRSSNVFHRYSSRHGLRPQSWATAFGEDSSGQLWIGFRDGEVVRYQAERFIQEIPPAREPERRVGSILDDGHGRVWISINQRGLLRIDTRRDGPDRARLYTTADGLASNNVGVVTQDSTGDLYVTVGGAFGVDRLDPRTDRIQHLSAAVGAPAHDVWNACPDRSGSLWFAADAGLFRYIPAARSEIVPPSTLIGRLQIDGEPVFVPPLGGADLGPFALAPRRNRLELSFFGLTPELDGSLRYQYRLEGAGGEWSTPTPQRTVILAGLAAGRYRFMVRAVSADGQPSTRPATVTFSVLRPVWQRWWFVTLAALGTTALVYMIHRIRVLRVIELERVRTRIASDLHDDIGSGLSQVAVLTAVLGRRVGSDPRVLAPLTAIGDLSRDLIDSMNDIVWAINPRRDHVSDLTHRMRRFASEVFGARDISLHFSASDPSRDFALGPDVRREVWLIFKESVNNAARHAACTHVDIAFTVTPRSLELSIHDNGRGFDPEAAHEGTGLASMRQRAARLRAVLDVTSAKEGGTTVTLRFPLGRRAQ